MLPEGDSNDSEKMRIYTYIYIHTYFGGGGGGGWGAQESLMMSVLAGLTNRRLTRQDSEDTQGVFVMFVDDSEAF